MSQLDVLARTYQIMVPSGHTGTMFLLDVDGRQYIITAKHLVQESIDPIYIYWEGGWQLLPVNLVDHCEGEVDISVLHTNQNLSQMLYPQGNGLAIETDPKLAEEVRFYGFPHGWNTSRGGQSVPVALVKRGIISGFFGAPLGSTEESFLIDGHNNPGFSGGPVVAIRDGEYKVAGVISAYRYGWQKVYGVDASGEVDKDIIAGYLKENTGIAVADNIKPALDVIAANPIGLPIA